MKKCRKLCWSRNSRGLPASLLQFDSFIWIQTGAIFISLLVALLHGPLILAAEPAAETPYRTDRILIKPVSTQGRVSLKAIQSYRVLRRFDDIGWQLVGVPPGVKILDALANYQASGTVSQAEPDYLVQGTRIPDDPSFIDGTQWGLNNVGQDGGTPDVDIDAPEGWEVLHGAPTVTVAVVDTGIRYTHEDLAANMWVNAGEIPNNGVDDDRNGVVDDIHGFNAYARSGNPLDDNGHGTHVAGILGAVGNNAKGIAGVAWNVRIMACKFLDANNRGAISDAIECIHYARKNGAQIINASWQAGSRSTALQNAIAAARDAGIIFVTAAGNESQNLDVTPRYPASYTLDNIVAVGSAMRTGALDSAYSNFGAATVDLVAPGVSIFSTWFSSDASYHYMSGTSMAAPYVTGVLALMRAYYPGESYKELIARLLAATDPVESLAGRTVSGGCVNLRKALGAPEINVAKVIKPASVQVLTQSDRTLFRVEIKGQPGKPCVVQVSTNFVDWTSFSTNLFPSGGSLVITDPAAGAFKQRYYRSITFP
jgi:subtilisin family serine protease